MLNHVNITVNHSSVCRKHSGYAQSNYVNHNVDIHEHKNEYRSAKCNCV